MKSRERGMPLFKRRKPEEAPEPTATPPGSIFSAPKAETTGAAHPAEGAKTDAEPYAPPPRPSLPKELQPMSRPPVPTAPSPGAPSPMMAPRPPGAPMPGSSPARPVSSTAERRTLVVGRGISVQGSVQDAERLVVEGTVEATNIRAAELSVSQGGVFRGEIEVDEAELAGTIDGTLVTNGTLIVRATGKLLGAARCRRLQVEDGGQISGRLEMLTDPPKAEGPRLAAVPPAVEAVGSN